MAEGAGGRRGAYPRENKGMQICSYFEKGFREIEKGGR